MTGIGQQRRAFVGKPVNGTLKSQVDKYRNQVCADIEAIGELPSFLSIDAGALWQDVFGPAMNEFGLVREHR